MCTNSSSLTSYVLPERAPWCMRRTNDGKNGEKRLPPRYFPHSSWTGAHVHTPSLWMPVIGYDSFSFASVYDCTTEWFIPKARKTKCADYISCVSVFVISRNIKWGERTQRQERMQFHFLRGGPCSRLWDPLSDSLLVRICFVSPRDEYGWIASNVPRNGCFIQQSHCWGSLQSCNEISEGIPPPNGAFSAAVNPVWHLTYHSYLT